MKNLFFLLLFICCSIFANSLSEIRETGVVRVGVLDGQPPFSTFKNGGYEGFEVDFANELAKRIFDGKNGKVEFYPTSGSRRIVALENNEVDFVLATFTITEERAKKVDFSMPYFAVNVGVLTKKQDKIKKLSDLKNKSVVVGEGTTGQDYFNARGFNTIVCPNSLECYKKLKNNSDVYGYVDDNLVVLGYQVVDRDTEANILNLGASDFLGIAVQKGNKELLDFINKQLIKMSQENFFSNAFQNTINPFYKGTAEEKYFLLDEIYRIFG